MKFIIDRFLLLPIGALVALVWANAAGESYFRVAHALAFPVNEIGMALFLGLLAQELMDALLPGGALHSIRRWILPVLAAAGGMVGSVLVYLAWIQLRHELVLEPGWPVVLAIDMAAGYYVLRLIAPRSAAIPFFLAVAAVTNAVALSVVAVRAGGLEGHPAGLMLIAGALAGAALARRASRRSLGRRRTWFYPAVAACSVASWIGFYSSGLHPALSLAGLVPFLPHEARRDVFADVPDDDEVHHFEHRWNTIVQVVLFLFGLVNAGVLVGDADTGSWAVLGGVLLGRPLGMLVTIGLAEAAGLSLPSRISWRLVLVVALAASSGFTFALFLAWSVLPVGAVLGQIKVGALASAAGAVLAFGAGRLLLGRDRVASPREPVFASSHRY